MFQIVFIAVISSAIGCCIGYFSAWREMNNWIKKLELIYPIKNAKEIDEEFFKRFDPDYN